MRSWGVATPSWKGEMVAASWTGDNTALELLELDGSLDGWVAHELLELPVQLPLRLPLHLLLLIGDLLLPVLNITSLLVKVGLVLTVEPATLPRGSCSYGGGSWRWWRAHGFSREPGGSNSLQR